MRDEPPEEAYPEGLYGKFTIEVTLDQESGNYMIHCPEWGCDLAGGKWPGDRVRGLVDEIVRHNVEELREADHGTNKG